MSTQQSNKGSRKQPANVYTVMMLMSMLFMLVAVIAMFVELKRYAPDYHNTKPATPNVSG